MMKLELSHLLALTSSLPRLASVIGPRGPFGLMDLMDLGDPNGPSGPEDPVLLASASAHA